MVPVVRCLVAQGSEQISTEMAHCSSVTNHRLSRIIPTCLLKDAGNSVSRLGTADTAPFDDIAAQARQSSSFPRSAVSAEVYKC